MALAGGVFSAGLAHAEVDEIHKASAASLERVLIIGLKQ